MLRAAVDVQETDIEWEKWGARDPYFGVLTQPQYRASTIAEADYLAFFDSGRGHAESVLATCRRHFGEQFHPARVLDFGCGVGRVLLPFARLSDSVVGVDISDSMLAEARRNCVRFGITNATLARADDRLSAVAGQFDLVHSTIVLQHIESERGLDIVANLVARVAAGGCLSIHVTYGRDYGDIHYGRPVRKPPTPSRPLHRRALSAFGGFMRLGRQPGKRAPAPSDPGADPVMMMYHYDLSRIAYILHAAGATGFFADFTNHGGELGATLYARVSPRGAASGSDAAQFPSKVD